MLTSDLSVPLLLVVAIPHLFVCWFVVPQGPGDGAGACPPDEDHP